MLPESQRLHRRQLGDAGQNLGKDRPSGDGQRLCVDGLAGQAGPGKEQGVGKVIEKVRDVNKKSVRQRKPSGSVEPCPEQHDGDARRTAQHHPREMLEPQQKQQENRGAETHAEG